MLMMIVIVVIGSNEESSIVVVRQTSLMKEGVRVKEGLLLLLRLLLNVSSELLSRNRMKQMGDL